MISSDEIKNLANLSRIELSEEEALSLQGEIESILGYIDTVKKSSDTAVESVRLLENVAREDIVLDTRGKYRDRLLALSPEREGNYFKVKKIIE